MRADIVPGAVFPDYELTDHTKARRRLSVLQGGDPMILVLSRGHFCPKDHQHHLRLAAHYPEIAVAYTQIVMIATDNFFELNEFRASVGAQWTFLSDVGRKVQRTWRARSTPTRPMIPHTLVFKQGLVVHSIYNGYWYWGRPSIADLRRDLREVAPVSALFVIRCSASAATSAGSTTRRIGRVSRSSRRCCSRSSPSRRADMGVSTNPVAIAFTRTGASSTAAFGRGYRGGRDGREHQARAGASGVGAGHEGERSAGADTGGALAGDAQRSQQPLVEDGACLVEVEVDDARVGRPPRSPGRDRPAAAIRRRTGAVPRRRPGRGWLSRL